MHRKKLIAGNWKMNMDRAGAAALARDILSMSGPDILARADIVLCPAFVHLDMVGDILRGGAITLGAQDCSENNAGAHTGDVSPAMLVDMGCTHVILGHSERRQNHFETSGVVRRKAQAAHKAGLITIICVGETDTQREAGQAQAVVSRQLAHSLPDTMNEHNTIIAYEPVWAIGTGKTATPEDASTMHGFIRSVNPPYAAMTILYGGSMKADNAAALLTTPHIDGGLVGGASLKAADFMGIARSA